MTTTATRPDGALQASPYLTLKGLPSTDLPHRTALAATGIPQLGNAVPCRQHQPTSFAARRLCEISLL